MEFYYKHPSTITVEPGSKESIDKFMTQVLSKDLNAAVVDRTGNLNNFCSVLNPIPAQATTKLDFNTVVDDRAKEIVDGAVTANKAIRMEWNGSLPSSVILVSVSNYLETLTTKPDVTVFVTSKANTRRTEFYAKYITNSTVFKESTEGLSKINKGGDSGDYVTLWDDCGQILFSVGYIEISDYDTPFVDVCEPDLYDILKPVLDAKPADWDNTLSTAIHWLGFTMKWQWSSLKRFIKSPLAIDDIKLFYNTDTFQQWFMQVPALEKHPGLINKKSQWQCREYIKQHHYDETMDLCNFVTGRGYSNMESSEVPNPIEFWGKHCVGITANMEKLWQEKGKMAFEIVEDDNTTDVKIA